MSIPMTIRARSAVSFWREDWEFAFSEEAEDFLSSCCASSSSWAAAFSLRLSEPGNCLTGRVVGLVEICSETDEDDEEEDEVAVLTSC